MSISKVLLTVCTYERFQKYTDYLVFAYMVQLDDLVFLFYKLTPIIKYTSKIPVKAKK